MPLPISKSQVRKLGSRLRTPGPPSEDDLDLLAGILSSYDEALAVAREGLLDVGLTPSVRLKNTGTILEKLRRGGGMNLAAIQDIAGLRVVLDPDRGRVHQDEAVRHVMEAFSVAGDPPRVFDRRAEPSHGYRAVHVVAEVLDVPVEIQVRTSPQHRWAQFFEKLADQLGRDIRYGGPPSTVRRLLADPRFSEDRRHYFDTQAGVLVALADALAEGIDGIEADHPSGIPADHPAWNWSITMIERADSLLHELMRDIRAVIAS